MATIDQQIEALEFERDGYEQYGKTDRVDEVNEQIEHWKAEREKHGGDAIADDDKPARDRSVGDGIITEAEAAKEGPVDGEAEANKRAEAHARQKFDVADTALLPEDEAAKEQPQGEEIANENAAAHRAETPPDSVEPHTISEADAAKQARREAAAAGANVTPTDAKAPNADSARSDQVDYNAKTIDQLKDILKGRDVDFSKFSLKGEYVEAAETSDPGAPQS